MKQNVYLGIVLSLSLVACLALNFANFNAIQSKNPANQPLNARSLLKGQTIWSIDNEYYLTPPNNYLRGKGWRFSMDSMVGENSEPVGDGSYYRRVPGYSLWYLVFVGVLGEENGLFVLKYAQVLLFLLSVYCIFQLLVMLQAHQLTILLVSLLYGIVPFFSANVFFTMTEALSPYLMVFYLYFLFKAHIKPKSKLPNYILASFFIGYAILTRPIVGIAGILLPIFLFLDYGKISIGTFLKKSMIVGSLAGCMVGLWFVRNYNIGGEFVLLEKSNHPESLDRMKPEFEALWRFVRCWGQDGGDMNQYQIPMFFAALNNDTTQKHRDKAIATIPDYALKLYGKPRLHYVFKQYQLLIAGKYAPHYKRKEAMPKQHYKESFEVAQAFDSLTKEFKQQYPRQMYIKTPIKYTKDLIIHSNTSGIFLFQQEFRHIFLLNLYRYFLVLLHVLLYVSLFFTLFLYRKDASKWCAFVLVPFLSIFFFVYIFQAIEQRYMLPFLPFIVLGTYQIFDTIWGYLGLHKQNYTL